MDHLSNRISMKEVTSSGKVQLLYIKKKPFRDIMSTIKQRLETKFMY